MQDDPDKWNPFLPGNFLEQYSNNKQGSYEILDIKNIVNIVKEGGDTLYLPNLDSVYRMSTVEIKTFQLVAMRWVSELEESKFTFKVRP